MRKRLIVIGGGASGFFCAVNAKRLNPEMDVVIVEKSSKILSKVRISGGGRCNVTHQCSEIGEMAVRYPRGSNLVKKTFHQFFAGDTLEWFAERGVEIKAEADGRMFPATNTSQTIIDCLVREMNLRGVQLIYNKEVKALRQTQLEWEVITNDEIMTSDFVCVACGGSPKASSFSWLTDLGHHIENPVPSLFTFNMPGNPITTLMGVSVEKAQVKISGTRLQESGPLLITHWGLSGPAILKLSAWGARALHDVDYQFRVVVNWVPDIKEAGVREEFRMRREASASQKVISRSHFGLPQRLWEFLAQGAGCSADLRWADLPAAMQNKLVNNLVAQEFSVSGKTTYKEEFVTAGGINLQEVNSNTMESKLLKGLYFAGEIMNVDGITGGYNFQHAWTSGYIAAKSIAAAAQDNQVDA